MGSTEALRDRVVEAIGHQYALEGEIGRGGMSVVYRARDVRLNRPVAIKVLPPELAHDMAIRARFTREAQTAAQLAHSHIVPIYDVGEQHGIAYLVMAIVSGGNLAALLAHEPQQPIAEARRILAEIADALDYAHLRGVIHRDIKPDNILLDRDTGRAQVTDFGIAWAMESASRLTKTGIAVGTPTYMSPEQAVGERELDGRTDIYSLGVIAYQMLTGRVPFSAGNSMALLLKHVTERPPSIAELRPDTPRPLREAIDRALMKSPEDRWPTAASLRDALTSGAATAASWRSEPPERVRVTSPSPERSRHDAPRGDGRAPALPVPPRPVGSAESGRSRLAVAEDQAGAIVLEPEHLAPLTPAQRADLRLWNGRITLMDRIKAMRGYARLTALAVFGGVTAFAFGASEAERAFPLLFGPIVPAFMMVRLWRRGKSLRASGLKLRRVLLMPRASWVLPKPPGPGSSTVEQQLVKLVPREILNEPLGAVVRQAVEDRAAIKEIVGKLSRADRALIPDLQPAVNALVDRVAHLAQMVHRLDQSIDPRAIDELDARIGALEGDSSGDGDRRLALLRQQRETLSDLLAQRERLARQLDSAGLMLGSLRLDVIKLRSSGLQSVLPDVSSATQEARALSREIGLLLDAAAEVRKL
jgi:serine/threonine-protein kinase